MNFSFLTGHESFYLREGWLTKGLHVLAEAPHLFQSQNLSAAIDELGMGANMVKSLKYWLLYFGIGRFVERGQNLAISDLGRVILEEDPYIQLNKTLWLLHINSVCNAPLWTVCCKSTEMASYSKDYLLQKLTSLVKSDSSKSYSSKTCASYIDAFMNIYLWSSSADIESNLQSPLSKLKLITPNKDERFKSISFRTIATEELDCRFIFYILFCIEQNTDDIHAIDLETAYHSCRSYTKMDLTSFRNWLRGLERTDLIRVDRAAGLNMINPLQTITANDMATDILRD